MSIKQQAKFVLGLIALVTLIEVINLVTQRSLNSLGNLPRHLDALPGIVFGPWLHASISHYLSNIFPLALFSFLILQYGAKNYLKVSLFIIIGAGLLLWLFGRTAMHIGASGLVYGYFAFLLLAGFINGQVKLIAISLLVLFFYGGLIYGVLPRGPFISWESHLFGFLTGLAAARIWAKS